MACLLRDVSMLVLFMLFVLLVVWFEIELLAAKVFLLSFRTTWRRMVGLVSFFSFNQLAV